VVSAQTLTDIPASHRDGLYGIPTTQVAAFDQIYLKSWLERASRIDGIPTARYETWRSK
jgi:hypothetical protein